MFRTQWRGLDKLRRVCGSESWIRYYRFSNVNRQGNEAFSTLDLALSDCIRGLLDDSESKCLLPSPLVERLSRVTSLNPASLSASDYIKLQKRNLTSAIISSPRPFASKKHYSDFSGAPFPSGTRGFFYAATHPTLPLATELRFRITDRASPKSFMLGRDMLNEDGFPWHIPLLALLSNDEFAPIVNRLEQDGLIPARADLLHRHREDRWAVERYNIEDDSEAADHRSILNLTAWPSDKPAVLYAFGQPFSYSFGETGFGKGHPEFLYLVSRTGVERLRTDEIFSISSMEMIVRTVMAARRRRPTEEDWLRPITIHEPPHA
ncbi:hypothetical protein L226DRAFT_68973 [Lentinus tigrinus ALCF2SS1-7]|uniref:uncharacterized protein n=1 Tax=Lentinus tigrinus ALCF2SS1-7 TaxID=1328758 RepID=UPI001165D0A0|nr:hypothetical protein L226DRAFT_68973 [Lentinus tigrinus ALCF2SS1-7]